MPNANRSTVQARDAQVIAGIQKYLQSVSTLSLAGTPITPVNLVKLFQSQIDQINAVAAAKAKWNDAVEANRALGAQITPVLRGLRSYLLNTYGSGSSTLADFGFSPPMKVVKTPQVKLAAAQKAKATRAARHTMGKSQKQEVKGNVTGVIVTPVTSGSTPTVTAPSSPVAPATSGPTPVTTTARPS